jgi:phosphomannomutase
VSLKFGTSGLRGLSVDLIGRPTAVYVSAFAQHLIESGLAVPGDKVFVGRDFRASSPSITETAMLALQYTGLVPVDCGTIPTPALALYAMEQGSSALMVTGSHIPADRNGIKFYRPDGEIDKQDEQEIVGHARTFESMQFDFAGLETSIKSHVREAEKNFLARNMSVFPKAALKGLRIGVYQHSTVARDLFVTILEWCGAEVIKLGYSENFIPVDTEAVSPETLKLLKAWSSTMALDAIVSADGDGDRPLVADENGTPLRGDVIGVITAELLSARVMVTPITSNSSLEKMGVCNVVRTQVGSPYVIAGMNQVLAGNGTGVIGFEANGGVLTASDFVVNGAVLKALPTRDSFLPVLATLLWRKKNDKPLSQLIGDRAIACALSDRLENFPLEDSRALMSHLMASMSQLSHFLHDIGLVAETNILDGLRVTLNDQRIIHFRPSGNAPELRCYVEAPSLDAAQNLLQKGLAALQNFKMSRQKEAV